MLDPIKPEIETVRFTADLDRDLHTSLKLLAIQEKCTMSDVARYAINRLITERLNRNSIKDPEAR